ncbi:hypothetical protein CC1G_04398 [Coprinopsis cinerea okayama7|uniref:Chalcone isomerase domain-containing protein n=1 Tax=Coprinopsis cinerea (strain Okayama-7 / 130 / ATCC MYA-4618 / FGSC 9003) TaxID=240176 RepID=A8N0H7_COPC7|nr:hypothetical protein CC1G_04398 [Coprinopsis cinerea okayama7\|eukprot:XP_001828427.1 hypothetical protein CC1G_04398 [Coprinopsis cinerea okayama7\
MSSLLLRSLSFARSACRQSAGVGGAKRTFSSSTAPSSTNGFRRGLACALGLGTLAASVAYARPVHLDAGESAPVVVDPATNIEFPKAITVQANTKLPPLSLVGVGVRTVSFIGIKVYSVGFYADLNNPNLKIPKEMSPEDKVREIIKNTACVVRIVPTRSTSYTHLRDAFMRALQGRLAVAKKEGTITEQQEFEAGGPMRKLKSIFPIAPLGKHVPLDMYLAAPTPGKPRALVFRDLGAIENDWVATELVLHYFEGDGPSPPLKKSVLERLENFSR